MEETQLTDKQKRFAEEYILDLNARQAAIRAGYSEATAQEQASRLLSNVKVQAYVKQLQEERSERTKISADRVLEELAKLGFSDLKSYTNDDWTVKTLDQIKDQDTAAIQTVKTTVDEVLSLDGKSIHRKTRVEFKLHPKLPPLQLIGQHLGMFNDKTPAGTLPPVTDKDETDN